MENIKKLALELEELNQEYSRLSWAQYTTGYDFGVEKQYNKILEKFSSKNDFEIVKRTYERNDLSFEDKRRAEIMFKAYEPFHLSKEINELSSQIEALTTKLSGILNTHRSILNGSEISSVDITQILRSEDDSEKRKAAFLSRSQVNKALIDGGFLELIKLRKEYAKLRGFKDFVVMKLTDDDLNTELFANWKNQLHDILPKMNKARAEVANKFLMQDTVMPWDELYVSSKIAPSLNSKVDMSDYYNVLRKFFLRFGIDIGKYNITYDVFSRANKSEWGYNFPIAAGKDSRILANVKNQYNEYGVLLHETGHGVHSFLQDPNEVILNMGISGIITEGIANLFGSFLYDEIFYSEFFKDNKSVKAEFEAYREYSKVNALRAISNIMFDQNLYRSDVNSLEDINELAFKTQKDYLMEDAFGDEYPWGYRIHHTTHPIYLHNYFMGDVTCEMLRKSFFEKYNCTNIMENPTEFAEYLINIVIKPSGLYKYHDLFKKISGEDFSLNYML